MQHSCDRNGSSVAAEAGHKAWESHLIRHTRVTQSRRTCRCWEIPKWGFLRTHSGFWLSCCVSSNCKLGQKWQLQAVRLIMYNHEGKWYLPSLFEDFLTLYLFFFSLAFFFFRVGSQQVAWYRLLLSATTAVASIWKSFPCNRKTFYYMFILRQNVGALCMELCEDAKYLHCSVEQVTADLICITLQHHSYMRLKSRSNPFSQKCMWIAA